jgi:hypothetical protein
MWSPKGKCGCQYFILLIKKKNHGHSGPGFFLIKKLILDYYFCLKSGSVFLFSLDPFSRHNQANSPGSVFCVLCNRQIQYKINHTVNYVNVETFFIYTYILSLIFRWRLKPKCDSAIITNYSRRFQSKTKFR